jgi:hypothetical protein
MAAKFPEERVKNLKIVQKVQAAPPHSRAAMEFDVVTQIFSSVGVAMPCSIEKISKGQFQDNYDMLQVLPPLLVLMLPLLRVFPLGAPPPPPLLPLPTLLLAEPPLLSPPPRLSPEPTSPLPVLLPISSPILPPLPPPLLPPGLSSDARDRLRHPPDERVAAAGVENRGLQHVGKPHGAPVAEQRKPRTEGAGHAGGEVTGSRDRVEAE